MVDSRLWSASHPATLWKPCPWRTCRAQSERKPLERADGEEQSNSARPALTSVSTRGEEPIGTRDKLCGPEAAIDVRERELMRALVRWHAVPSQVAPKSLQESLPRVLSPELRQELLERRR